MSFRSGFVGLIGQPNAGKSTLLNGLVNEKISIVTPKPQTTRRRILGIVSSAKGQVVFVDSPGVLDAEVGLNAFLSKEAKDVIAQSDVLVAVLNPDAKKKEDIDKILKMVQAAKRPWVAVITKVDMANHFGRIKAIKDLLATYTECKALIEFSNTWGVDDQHWKDQLLSEVLRLLPETKEPLYDIELFTPHSVRELTAEIIREKCFECLDKEVPYGLAARVDQYDESNPKLPKIYVSLVVARDAYKPIVVGKGGQTIKEIGTRARKELEKLIGEKVFLKLDVVVRPDWFDNRNIMKELGYVVEKRK